MLPAQRQRMCRSPLRLRIARYVKLSCVSVALVSAGCNDIAIDAAPTGEQLCQEFFEACVAPILLNPIDVPSRGVSVTCAAEGCHDIASGSGGAFKLYRSAVPASDDMSANYLSARSFSNVSDPPLSRLLLEPLAGSDSVVGSHGGGDIFADPNDTRYQEIYYWITHPQTIASEACPALDHFPSDATKRCLDDGTP